jgi:hypothetical protein
MSLRETEELSDQWMYGKWMKTGDPSVPSPLASYGQTALGSVLLRVGQASTPILPPA